MHYKRARGLDMNKKILLLFLCATLLLIIVNLASAYIIRDVAKDRQEELERYEQYKADYIKFNDLEAFSQYVDERNLVNSFGFRPASYYYVPPSVLAAKYNPPLQGDAYYTSARGYSSSLYQPSAVQYYGEQMNGRYVGYIPSTRNGVYFDHPQMSGAQGYLTANYPAYDSYDYGYGSGYDSGYGSMNNNFGIPPAWNSGSYGYGNSYGYDYGYGYNYGYDYSSYYDAYDTTTGEPAFYARIAEPLSGGFYVVGFY